MTGNIVGEPIIDEINKQIDYRQQVHGAGYLPNSQNPQRTPAVQNYLNNRNSWIKMASGISLSNLKADDTTGTSATDKLTSLSSDGSNYLSEKDIEAMMGVGLAENLVLFNGTQKFNTTEIVDDNGNVTTPKNSYSKRSGVANSYGFLENLSKMYGGLGGSQRGLQPVPGIIDMSVECLNRGSIRKATVKLKAYNKFQFGLIELLYLRLGYSVMLEWGWDKYIDEITPGKDALTPPTVTIKDMESTIIENQWFDGNDYSQSEMIDFILKAEEFYKGNYGGFFGTVSNFSWVLNKDNTYDITLNLITVGSVIESLDIKIPAISLDTNTIKATQKLLNDALGLGLETPKAIEESDNMILSNVGSDKLSQWVSNTILNFEDLILGSLDYVSGEELTRIKQWQTDVPKQSRFFVRFATLLSFIGDKLICDVINSKDVKDKEVIIELDTEEVKCNYEVNLVPLNANKVIFSVVMEEEVIKRINSGATTTTPIDDLNRNLSDFAIKQDGVIYGQLLNCYLNLTFIQQAFVGAQNNKEEVSLFKFLQNLCDGINESTGNCTNLEVVLKKDKTITFIDQNQIKGGDKLIPKPKSNTPLNIYGYETNGSSTFVKDFKFQTKITPNLMNMVTIGATSTNEKDINSIPFQEWNKGLVNRFGQSQQYEEDDALTKSDLEDEEMEIFKKTFAADILADGINPRYYSGNFFQNNKPKGYYYTYNNITIIPIWVPGVGSLISDRLDDSTNKALLSEGWRKYKLEKKKKAKTQKGKTNIIKSSKEADNNYMVYLIRAFGGDSGYTETVAEVKEANTPRQTTIYTNKPIIESRTNALYFKWGNDDFIQQGKNAFKKYLSNKNKKEAEALTPIISGTGFIPLELSITMDGLSGIKIYNRLNINTKFLPSSYPKSLKFIVKGVDHKVSNNVWDTNISTISVPVSITPPKTITGVNQTTKKKSGGIISRAIALAKATFNNLTSDQKVTMVKGLSLEQDPPATTNGLIYWPEETDKTQIVLHHTADNAPIENTINFWRRGKKHISTHFIINRDGDYDQLFPLKYWGNHLGKVPKGKNPAGQKRTITIELEGQGYLKYVNDTGKRQDGTFPDTAQFQQVSPDRTETFTYKKLKQGINEPAVATPVKMNSDGSLSPVPAYRGYQYYQAYTKPQLDTLRKVLKQIQAEYPNIPIGSTPRGSGTTFSEQFPKKDVDVSKNQSFTPVTGIYTHNSYRLDKSDVFPQKELIELLQEFN